MITASTSSRLTAEATPAPSAFSARSISFSASSVVVLERPLPDPAREPVAPALLHDLEQLRLRARRRARARAFASIAPRPGVGLHAAPPPARAAGAAALDHHVADLARGAAAGPALAVEDQAAADAGAPEDAEQRVVGLAGAELELGVGGDVDVVADPHRGAERVRERPARAGSCRSSRAGCWPRRPRRSARSVSPGEPTPIPASESVCTPGRLGGLDQRLGHRLGDVLRAALGRGRAARLARDLAGRARRSPPGSSSRRDRSRRARRRFLPASGRVYRSELSRSSAPEWATIAATIISSTDGTRTSATTSWIFGAERAARSSIRRRASRRSEVACR